MFCKKGVLRNFAKFTGKHLCQSLFLNIVAGLRPATLLKKETLAQVFSCEFCEFSKNTFFTKHLWWLLLSRTFTFYLVAWRVLFAHLTHLPCFSAEAYPEPLQTSKMECFCVHLATLNR